MTAIMCVECGAILCATKLKDADFLIFAASGGTAVKGLKIV